MFIEKLRVSNVMRTWDELIDRLKSLPGDGAEFLSQMLAEGYIESRGNGRYSLTEKGVLAIESLYLAPVSQAA